MQHSGAPRGGHAAHEVGRMQMVQEGERKFVAFAAVMRAALTTRATIGETLLSTAESFHLRRIGMENDHRIRGYSSS